MPRARISTTVDAHRLGRLRHQLGVPDSELIDRALCALSDDLEADRERATLTAMPYDDDPELSWRVPPGPDLPYEGRIPEDVTALARERRRAAWT